MKVNNYFDIFSRLYISSSYKLNEDINYLERVVPHELNMTGRINFKGKKVKNAKDLADIFSVIRDYRYETFRIIYIRKNKIVGSDSVSSQLAATSSIMKKYKDLEYKKWFSRSIAEYKNKYDKLHADGFYLLHNHPSGNSNPSMPDFRVTAALINKFGDHMNFLGHVVLGDKEAILFYPDGVCEEMPIENIIDRDNIETLESPLTNTIVADFAKKYMSKNKVVLIYIDAQSSVNAVQEADFYEFNNDNIDNYIRNRALENGASRVFAVTDDEDIYNLLIESYYSEALFDVIGVFDNEVVSWRNTEDIPPDRKEKNANRIDKRIYNM